MKPHQLVHEVLREGKALVTWPSEKFFMKTFCTFITFNEADFEPRTFRERVLQHCAVFVQFVSFILFTEDAGFTRDDSFNYHKSHVWDYQNPQEVRLDKHQQRFSLNVWGGIIHDHIIGPYFFPDRRNGETYLQFPRTELIHFLDAVPLDVIQRMWFMRDGATSHITYQCFS